MGGVLEEETPKGNIIVCRRSELLSSTEKPDKHTKIDSFGKVSSSFSED